MKILKMLSVLIVPLVLALNGCSSKPEELIVGKWKEIDATEIIEFFKDETINAVDKDISATGTYSFIDKNRLKIEYGGVIGSLAGPLIYEVSFNGDVLTTTNSKGEKSKYRRLK